MRKKERERKDSKRRLFPPRRPTSRCCYVCIHTTAMRRCPSPRPQPQPSPTVHRHAQTKQASNNATPPNAAAGVFKFLRVRIFLTPIDFQDLGEKEKIQKGPAEGKRKKEMYRCLRDASFLVCVP